MSSVGLKGCELADAAEIEAWEAGDARPGLLFSSPMVRANLVPTVTLVSPDEEERQARRHAAIVASPSFPARVALSLVVREYRAAVAELNESEDQLGAAVERAHVARGHVLTLAALVEAGVARVAALADRSEAA